MISVIGFKRIVLLLVFLAINGLFAAMIYGYLAPQNVESERKIRSLKGQINTVQVDIERMQLEFEQLGRQQGQFDALKADGFFKPQGRTLAKEALKNVQDKSKVISAVASIDPGRIEENKEAQKSKHKVLISPVEIKLKAFDDRDVYRYIHILQETFPGHISIDSMEIKRTRDVSAAVLRAIVTGINPELVAAKMELSWRTMIPEDQVITSEKEN